MDDTRPGPEPTELVGRWHLERTVQDRRHGRSGTVTGTLRIEPGPDGLVWAESGLLVWQGRTVPVHRTLQVRPAGRGWEVTFEDGRPFHPWVPGTWVDHLCGADHYRGLVEVGPDRRRVDVTWVTTGPTKDDVLRTRLTRTP
ncbi:DUF6314 family protein [Auraticoccus monumenti]|uniref:DUF6314 domain-containing protein n=1 Tax=Auraticoccus monumenti TaxID=675864 RepID=A0A1G6XAT8_9ACTN|nr:DUF6314 family protein [Auraticoccus monumenti]SDD75304.1 hypothetical protein SAMN04489747_1660 [Auraticoccus monumenti]